MFGADCTTEVFLLSDIILEQMLTPGVVRAEGIAIFDHSACDTTNLVDLVEAIFVSEAFGICDILIGTYPHFFSSAVEDQEPDTLVQVDGMSRLVDSSCRASRRYDAY